MKKFKASIFVVVMILGCLLLVTSTTLTVVIKPKAASELELDSELISVRVKGMDYVYGKSDPIQLITDQVFSFGATMKNTGAATWGQDGAERGSGLISRDPDYGTTFATAFILPGQGTKVLPGQTKSYGAQLRAPATAGKYIMKWQQADWPVLGSVSPGYTTRPFFGELIIVDVIVTERSEEAPAQPGRVSGVIDRYDFNYEGSFFLPPVTGVSNDDKDFVQSGITLRTVGEEKRMILATGTGSQTAYEVAIPTKLGKIVGSDTSAITMAPLRTIIGRLTPSRSAVNPDPVYNPAENSNASGTIWYDEKDDLLYWTVYNTYLVSGMGIKFPVLRAGKIEQGKLTDVQQWNLPGSLGMGKSWWGGVTNIPESFAEKYTEGKRIALGFGGMFSGVQLCSFGPALAAIAPNIKTGAMDSSQKIFNYPYTANFDNQCTREGNYFGQPYGAKDAVNPWTGFWTPWDKIGSGVFIDLPDKKGYMVFANQAINRLGYDYGSETWLGEYQNVWYFYDYETLGNAAIGRIANNNLTPSSYTTFRYPNGRGSVAGSCFDPETRLLYVYTHAALPGSRNGGRFGGYYSAPAVHVYKVIEGDDYAK